MVGSVGTKSGRNEWVESREEALRDPYGWLSLVELVWLDDQPKPLSHFPGLWEAKGDQVTFTPDEGGVSVFQGDQLVTEPLKIEVQPGESDRSLRDQDGREIEIMYRFWGPAVRVRDPKANRLTQFGGLDRYDFDPTWVLRGRLLPFAEPRDIEVETAIEGGTSTVGAWANAEVSLPDGKVLDLTVSGDPESPHVMFYDETGMDETPGWRTVEVVVDGETVVVDMNRAQIFPAHLSPFGTCPKPPEENRIPARVEAGEKTFLGKDTQ